MRLKFITLLTMVVSLTTNAQETPTDTVIVPLGETSRVIFTIQDRKDLEVLRHYDFQELFEDIFDKLDENGGMPQDSVTTANEEAPEDLSLQEHEETDAEDDDYDSEEDDDDDEWVRTRTGRVGQTWQSFNLDLGMNNYLEDGEFPNGVEPYAVRPWGSWYVATNSVQRTKLGKNVFLEWALGVSWYNFKFQEDNILIQKDELGVHFVPDTRDVDFVKSKLTATYITASLVPVLDFDDQGRKPRMWDGRGDGFRFGLGPYVGYLIDGKSKLVYEEDDDKEKEKDHDNFYLDSIRYGLRIQIGVRSTDLFINYDMNELFDEGKGPTLNAVSFGVIF